MKTLILGSAIVDQIMLIDRLPLSGEDITCIETKTTIGGCAYNVASTMRNLDTHHDLYVPVGTGLYANLIRETLLQNGYPILFHSEEKDNGYCLTLVESNGERTFITVVGAEGYLKKDWLENINLDDYSQVYVDGYQFTNHNGKIIAEWLSANNQTQLFFAPGPVINVINAEVMNQLLSLKPILHINEKELKDFTHHNDIKQAVQCLHSQTQNLIIVTLGSKGAAYFDGTIFEIIPSPKVKIVDTIGAGDSHIGAILAGLSQGYPLKDAVILANKIAAEVVQTQGSIMTKENFIQKFGG